MWANYHSHSHFCDGKGALADYAARAKQLNMLSIGFSSHAPVPYGCKWAMRREDLNSYLLEIDQVQKEFAALGCYKGLEVDFVPGKISPLDFTNQLDYTIGSIHFVDEFDDGRPWEIDGSPIVFEDGLRSIFNGNFKDAVIRYFELTRQMINEGCPTILGHFDKIKIQNLHGKYFSESDQWYQNEVTKCVDLFAESGVIVEVNTRGLYQNKSTSTYPSPWILEMMRRRNIPITISSDAHHPDDLTNRFEETASLLFSIGYRKISILKDGSWQPTTLSGNGIT